MVGRMGLMLVVMQVATMAVEKAAKKAERQAVWTADMLVEMKAVGLVETMAVKLADVSVGDQAVE